MRIWSHDTGSAVPSRVSLLTSTLRLNLVLTYYGIPPDFCGGVHLISVHIIYYGRMQQYIHVQTMYHDISRPDIMLRQFDQRVPAQKMKVPREDLEVQ